jgi:L-fuconolactonase
MVTEADWHTWSDEVVSPYIEAVVEVFTPNRLMFGSDWPVMTLASSYQRWMATIQSAIAQLSVTERERILGGTAVEAYGLSLP